MDVELKLLQIARGNDGVVSRRAAIAAGISSKALDRRLRAGFLLRFFPSMYVLSAYPVDLKCRARGAFQWAGPGALLTGATNLTLRGVEGFEPGPIEIYVPSGKTAPGIRKKRLPDRPLVTRPLDGMVTTTCEQSLFDACTWHLVGVVGDAMDEALRRGLTSIGKLRDLTDDCAARTGASKFRGLVRVRDLDDAKVRSEMEARMLRILRGIRGRPFIPDFVVESQGRRYVFDFACPSARLAIECHSRRWHGAGRIGRDLERDRYLKSLGWTILYFTYEDVVSRPSAVRKEIQLFRARALGSQGAFP